MPRRKNKTGSELFIVDNSDKEWKVLKYLHDWCQISKSIDIATGYFPGPTSKTCSGRFGARSNGRPQAANDAQQY